MPLHNPLAPGSNATPFVNTPGNPDGMRPNLPSHSNTVVYSADGVELHQLQFFAGPQQTESFGVNFDLPFVGDGTIGVTFEYGKELDFGGFIELGPVWSPWKIDDGFGLGLPTDLSMGVNFYSNKGFVPFDTGIVHTMEHMGQYGLGVGFNVNEDGLITSGNGYGGLGAGASRTYDITINGSARDGLRWIVNQFTGSNNAKSE